MKENENTLKENRTPNAKQETRAKHVLLFRRPRKSVNRARGYLSTLIGEKNRKINSKNMPSVLGGVVRSIALK